MRATLSALPRSSYFYLFLAASPLLAIVVPLGMLLSHPLYTSTFDLSLVVVLLTAYSARRPSGLVQFGLLLLLPALLRALSIRYVYGLTTPQTLMQKRALFALSLLTVIANVVAYALPQSSRGSASPPYPGWLFALSLLSSLLVAVSVVWVPTSHQQAWEAETAVLKEAGLYPHVHRYKKAGLSYILLDPPHKRPAHSARGAEGGRREQRGGRQPPSLEVAPMQSRRFLLSR